MSRIIFFAWLMIIFVSRFQPSCAPVALRAHFLTDQGKDFLWLDFTSLGLMSTVGTSWAHSKHLLLWTNSLASWIFKTYKRENVIRVFCSFFALQTYVLFSQLDLKVLWDRPYLVMTLFNIFLSYLSVLIQCLSRNWAKFVGYNFSLRHGCRFFFLQSYPKINIFISLK